MKLNIFLTHFFPRIMSKTRFRRTHYRIHIEMIFLPQIFDISSLFINTRRERRNRTCYWWGGKEKNLHDVDEHIRHRRFYTIESGMGKHRILFSWHNEKQGGERNRCLTNHRNIIKTIFLLCHPLLSIGRVLLFDSPFVFVVLFALKSMKNEYVKVFLVDKLIKLIS